MPGTDEDPQMIDVYSNLGSAQEGPSRPPASVAPHVGKARRNSNLRAIDAGTAFILSEQRHGHWPDSGGTEVLTTAYVLARLGEVPYDLLSDDTRVRVRKALDWLIAARSPSGGWGRSTGAECDAETTAWAVIALRRQGRRVSVEDSYALRLCRHANGDSGKPDLCAVAANALTELDAECSDRLVSWLLEQEPASQGSRVFTALYTCSAILELGPVKASRTLLESVRDLVSRCEAESILEQALLLRCLLQLGLQRAWWVADDLRRTQLPDGSWPASVRAYPETRRGASALDESRIFAAMTAVSALAMANSQPGLFFGSEGLMPRRLYGA